MSIKPKNGWKLVRDSFTKLIVWFKDGNIRTFYSMDWKHKHSKFRDRTIGITRLKKLVCRWGNKASTAELYDTTTGQQIARFFEGVEIKSDKEKDQ